MDLWDPLVTNTILLGSPVTDEINPRVGLVPERVPFKEALGLDGKGANNWRRKPLVNIPPAIDVDGGEKAEVKEITDSRYHYRKNVRYQALWENYRNGEVDNTWYYWDVFANAPLVVAHFHQQNPLKPRPDDLP